MVRRVAGGVRIHGGDPGIQRLLGRLPDSSIRPSSPMRRRARPQRHREYRIGSRYAHRCWRRTFTGLFLVSQVSAAPWVFSQLRVYGGQLRLTRYCAGCHRADPAAGGALPTLGVNRSGNDRRVAVKVAHPLGSFPGTLSVRGPLCPSPPVRVCYGWPQPNAGGGRGATKTLGDIESGHGAASQPARASTGAFPRCARAGGLAAPRIRHCIGRH